MQYWRVSLLPRIEVLHSVPEPGARSACADTLVDNLTVQEMLAYTAEMKLEMGVGMAEKRARVEALLRQLALEPCRNVRIGGSMQRGISGALLRPPAACPAQQEADRNVLI